MYPRTKIARRLLPKQTEHVTHVHAHTQSPEDNLYTDFNLDDKNNFVLP